MKADLRYAEHAAKYNDDKLIGLGWRGRKAPTPLQLPGQPGNLEITREGPGWIRLKWKRPEDGGAVATYQVQVRHGNKEKDWQIVSLSFETMIELKDQKRGVDLAYRVITVNKAGEGLPSNVVTAVL